MTIQSFVTKNYPSVPFSQSVNTVKDTLLKHDYIVVLDADSKYYGLLTPADVLARPYKLIADCVIEKEPLDINISLKTATEKFLRSGISAFPVFEKENFWGILTRKVIFSYLYNNLSINNGYSIKESDTIEVQKDLKHLLTLFDETDALLFYKNLEGEYQYVNDAFAKYLKLPKENIIGKKVQNFLPTKATTIILENDKQVTSTGKSMTFEEALSEQGNDSIFLSNKTPIYHNNKVEGIFCVAHNISKQKKIENELKITNTLLIKTNKKLFDEIQARKQLENENCYLKVALGEYMKLDYIVCNDEKFKKVLAQAEQVANSETAVLITGETGTGKELIAKVIYDLSNRKDAPFVKINCAAIPEGLIESELFGHEKGAFTGAVQKKIGKFELANGGTIFLDEVGELPLSLQPKLLRVLQEKEFERIGGNFTQKTDVRIISATNKDLSAEVTANRFRKDLYYRLNVFPIHIPPLRERKKDIPGLVNHFVNRLSNKNNKHINFVSKNTLSRLIEYNWPGNIRELENVIERAIILSKGEKLSINGIIPVETKISVSQEMLTLEEVERNHILKILDMTSWKLGGDDGAASILGLNRSTLYHRMKRLGISYKKIVVK